MNGIEETESNNQFIEPEPGNVFWVLDVTVVNNGSEPGNVLFGLKVQDDQDFTHDGEFITIKLPDLSTNVPPGGRTRGYATFQMADGTRPVTVLFQPELFDASVVVSIPLE